MVAAAYSSCGLFPYGASSKGLAVKADLEQPSFIITGGNVFSSEVLAFFEVFLPSATKQLFSLAISRVSYPLGLLVSDLWFGTLGHVRI